MIRKRFPCRKTWDLYSLRIQKGLCIIVYCIQWPQNGEGSRFFRSTKHHSSESFEREEKKKGRNDCVTFLMFVSEKLGENEQDDKKRCQTEIKCTKMSLEMFLALQSKKGMKIECKKRSNAILFLYPREAKNESFDLPLHVVCVPDHLPSLRQVRRADPCNLYPSMHRNWTWDVCPKSIGCDWRGSSTSPQSYLSGQMMLYVQKEIRIVLTIR